MATIISNIDIKAEVIHRYDQTDRYDRYPHVVLCKELGKQETFGKGYSQDREALLLWNHLVNEVTIKKNNLIIFGRKFITGHGYYTRSILYIDKNELPEFIPVVYRNDGYCNTPKVFWHDPDAYCTGDCEIAIDGTILDQYKLVGSGELRTLRKK